MAGSDNRKESRVENPHFRTAQRLWNCFNAAAAMGAVGGLAGGALVAANVGVAAGLGTFFLALAIIPAAALGIQSGMKKAWPEIAEDISRMEFGNRYYWGTAFAVSAISAALLANAAGESGTQPEQGPPAFAPVMTRPFQALK